MIDKIKTAKTEAISTHKSSRFMDSTTIKKGLSSLSKLVQISKKDSPPPYQPKSLSSSVIINDNQKKQWILPIGLEYIESHNEKDGTKRTYHWKNGSATVDAQNNLLSYNAKKNKPTPFKEAITVTDGVGKKWFIPKDRVIHNTTVVGLDNEGLITSYTAMKKIKQAEQKSIPSGTEYTLNTKGKITVINKQRLKETKKIDKAPEPFLYQSDCHFSFKDSKTGEELFIPARMPYKKYPARFGKAYLEYNGKIILYSPPASEKANHGLRSVKKPPIKEETFVASEDRLVITGDNSFYIPKGMSYTKYEGGGIICQNKAGLFPDVINTSTDKKISDISLNDLKESLNRTLSIYQEGDIIPEHEKNSFVKQLTEYTQRCIDYKEESLDTIHTTTTPSIKLLKSIGLNQYANSLEKKIHLAEIQGTARLVFSCPDVISKGAGTFPTEQQKPYLEKALAGMVASADLTPAPDKKTSEMAISLVKSINKSTQEEQQHTINLFNDFLNTSLQTAKDEGKATEDSLGNYNFTDGKIPDTISFLLKITHEMQISNNSKAELIPHPAVTAIAISEEITLSQKPKHDSGISFPSQHRNSLSASSISTSSFTPTVSTEITVPSISSKASDKE